MALVAGAALDKRGAARAPASEQTMCGIFGIAFHDDKTEMGALLTKAGRSLSYRGYDSVGAVAITHAGEADLRKDIGKVEDVSAALRFEELRGNRGITQLRWATFGVPAKRNAQPHFDTRRRIVGAHNGNIVNTAALRRELTEKGHVFQGENDGEVVIHALEEAWNRHGDLDLAVREARSMLKGDYAYVATALKGASMVAAKMGSSLYLGVGEGFVCVSSDLPSLLGFTTRIVVLRDGEYVEFDHASFEVRDIETGRRIEREPFQSTLSPESAEKGDHAFFMGKEIDEQPERCRALIDFLGSSEDVAPFAAMIAEAPHVYLIGSGSSFNACVMASYFFSKLAGCATFPVVAGSFIEQFGGALRPGDLFVLVSQSGETKDLINVLNLLTARGMGSRAIGVVNVLGSTLMMRAERHLPLLSNLEIAVAATKTFLNQATLFLGLAVAIAESRGRDGDLRRVLAKLPDVVRATLDEMTPHTRELARRYKDAPDMYALGHGVTLGAALEGALKIKEITYSHCEGMDSVEFKHGPLAIVTEGYPVFFLSSLEDHSMVLSHIHEVTCRGGTAITIAPPCEVLEASSSLFFPLPCAEQALVPIAATVFMQLFAYHLACERGQSPDHPRNCSKTITVD
jgi:glucosamine--fructose-6-phosphate aminotransferase (isomerizing)